MTNQPNQEPKPLTRMRIPHIFLWMFASVVLLTALRQVNHYYVEQYALSIISRLGAYQRS